MSRFSQIRRSLSARERNRLKRDFWLREQPRYEVHYLNNYVNAQAHGATGNGLTDDSAAIARADSIARENGSLVYFPPGVYRISSAIAIGSGTHWIGHRAATIKHKGSTLHAFISGASSLSNVRFDGMIFDGDMANVSSAVIRWSRTKAFAFVDCTDVTFTDCEFTAMRGPAVHHSGCTRFNFEFCHIHDTDNWGVVGVEATDTVYHRNHVENIYTHGLYVDGAANTGALRVRMTNNTCINCAHDSNYSASGIGLSVNQTNTIEVMDVQIIGNTAESCGSMGFSLTPAGFTNGGTGRMIVADNISSNHTAQSGIAYEFIGQYISSIGNIARNNKYGITMEDCRHVSIVGGEIIMPIGSTTQTGIAFRPGQSSHYNENISIVGVDFAGGQNAIQVTSAVTDSPHKNVLIEACICLGSGKFVLTQGTMDTLKISECQVDNDVAGISSDGRCIQIGGATSNLVISSCTLKPPAAAAHGIVISAVVTDGELLGNTIIGGSTAINFSSGTSTGITLGGNTIRGQTSTNPVVIANVSGLTDLGTNSWNFVSAAPTTGYHHVGQRFFDTAVASGGFMGWVCTTAGTPGTFKTWGVVS